MKLTYGYGSSNNGNVTTITNNLSSGRTQTFTYDYLNRIKTAQSQATSGSDCWGQSFTYDSTYYTNLQAITSTKCSSQTLSLTITNKNRFSGTNVAFDNAGNLTNDGTGNTYSWDAENHLTTTASVTYTYDGDGQRVKKSNGTLYWHGLGGEVLAETDLSGNNVREFVYFGGARIARRENSGAVYYFFGDHLGTAKVMTNATGVTQQESTYYPFGSEQRVITNTVSNQYKFTGLERDAESGLDHTLFRKYPSNLARWLSPDPVAGTNPVPFFRGLVSCMIINGSGNPDVVNLSTEAFSADTSGDSNIEAKVELPSPCFAPIIFVTSPGGAWFSVTGK